MPIAPASLMSTNSVEKTVAAPKKAPKTPAKRGPGRPKKTTPKE